MREGIRVNIYGDSLMKGTIVDENFRYRAGAAKELSSLAEQFHISLNNRARFGNTIEKGRALLDKDIEEGFACDYALIEFGGNDCNFDWCAISREPQAEHFPFTQIEAFEKVCIQMVEDIRKQGATPVLMTLPPIDSEKYFKFVSRGGNEEGNILRWLGDIHMIYRFHEMYSSTVSSIAQRMRTLLIDVRSAFLDKRCFQSLIGPDGIHLSYEGYRVLFCSLREFVRQHSASALSFA